MLKAVILILSLAIAPNSFAIETKEICRIIADANTGKRIAESGGKFCSERLYACSTFKLPLAVMGFAESILKDEDTKFTWDGTSQMIPAWEQDHTARSWMKDSVVWYSQKITPQLGEAKLKKFLRGFQYGNEDISGGLTTAWLSSSLKISASEQVNFLQHLHKLALPTAKIAQEKALSLLPAELDTPEQKIVGKTGTCFSWNDSNSEKAAPYRIGWYIGYSQKGSSKQSFAVVFREKVREKKFSFAGAEAKKIALDMLVKP